MSGSFNNGKYKKQESWQLKINDFAAGIRQSKVNGMLIIENFRSPEISVEISSACNLSDIKYFLFPDTVESISGTLEIDLKFKNRLSGFRRFTARDFVSSYTSGSLMIRSTQFRLRGSPLDFIDFNGSFRFNNKDLIIESFSGKVSENDFTMNGYFGNILAWAFLPDQQLDIHADLQSGQIDLDKLLEYPGNKQEGQARLSFSNNVNYKINLTIEQFKFRKFRADHMTGILTQSRNILRLQNGRFSSMDGDVEIKGSIDGNDPQNYQIKCSAQTRDVNISKLFAYFGNFGQENLTSEQLNGTVTANTSYISGLTPDLHVDPAGVSVTSDLVIDRGELIGYTPLYKLSGFIEKDELRHIHFAELSNRIEISGQVVHIPHMHIASSSLDLELFGTHTFDNMIDYHVKLKMADILKRNKKNSTGETGSDFVKEDDEGQPNLLLQLTGPASDPTIRYDTREVRKKIAVDLAREKTEFKALLQDEFGGNKNRTRQAPGTDVTSKDFQIGWDETKKDTISAGQTRTDDMKQTNPQQENPKDFIIKWDEDNDTIH